MCDCCGDNRFEVIEKYKKALSESTNIEAAADEMAVLDSILFRFWQMGWLGKLEDYARRQEEIASLCEQLEAAIAGQETLHKHIVELKESGTGIPSSVRVGQTVYIIDGDCIEKLVVDSIHIKRDEDSYYEAIDDETGDGYWDFKDADIGKTVFFTLKEAVQEFKKRIAPDRVEHRGIVAFQGTCGVLVRLYKGKRLVAKIPVDRRQTVEEMKGIIDQYLKGVSGE